VGKKSRDKGARLERWTRKMLTSVSGCTWVRTEGGRRQYFGDVVPKGAAPEPWDALFIECKDHADVHPGHLIRPNKKLREWWETACEQAKDVELRPVLVVNFARCGKIAIASREEVELFGPDEDWRESRTHETFTARLALYRSPYAIDVTDLGPASSPS
jgi:hypothetical protein